MAEFLNWVARHTWAREVIMSLYDTWEWLKKKYVGLTKKYPGKEDWIKTGVGVGLFFFVLYTIVFWASLVCVLVAVFAFYKLQDMVVVRVY